MAPTRLHKSFGKYEFWLLCLCCAWFFLPHIAHWRRSELVSKHAAAAAVAAAPTSASASEKAGQGSPEMQLLVCGEGVVYKDQVAKACAGDGTGWQHSILLLAPLLLGLGKTIDETYLPSTFVRPQPAKHSHEPATDIECVCVRVCECALD